MIFDILSSNNLVEGQADFVADSEVLELAVNPPGVNGLAFADANGNTWFEGGDNILLQRLDLNIPFGFGQGTGIHQLGIAWKDEDGGGIIIPEFAGNSALVMPDFCGFDFQGQVQGSGLMIQAPKATADSRRFRLCLTSLTLNVSMLGLPTELDDMTIALQYHLRAIHTKPMAAVP